jgi:hypothetical protein
MLNEQRVTGCCKTLSWTAVIAGALVGVGLAFILMLFSVAIGLSAYSSTTDGAMNIAVGGLVGIAIGIIASMFASGYVAGYLDRPKCVNDECPKRHSGALNGFVAWCLALIISVSIAPHLHHYVTVYSNFVSNPNAAFTVDRPQSALDATAAATSNPSTPADETTTVSAATTAKSAFLVFILFILGALSSAFGGHFGMYSCCRKDTFCDTHDSNHPNNTVIK